MTTQPDNSTSVARLTLKTNYPNQLVGGVHPEGIHPEGLPAPQKEFFKALEKNLDKVEWTIIMCHINKIDFARNRITMNISRGKDRNDAFAKHSYEFHRGEYGSPCQRESHGSHRRGAPYGAHRRRVIRHWKGCLGCYADTYKQCYAACQVVAGDGREIGQRDAKRSHVLTSTTEDGVSAP